MATDLAKLVVKLEAQTAQYQKGLEGAQRQLAKFKKQSDISLASIGKGLAVAATAAGGALAYMGKQAIDSADRISKLSQSTGLSTEALSQLEYAADLSGVSSEALTKSLGRLSRTAADAAKGVKVSSEAFAKLGVNVKNADGSLRPTEDLLLDVADSFSKLENGAAKAALAQDLFGKAGMQLIPLLNQGRAGIKAMTDEADAFGLTVSQEAAVAAEQFNDNLTRLQAAGKGVVNQAVQQLLPTLAAITDAFVASAKNGGGLSIAITGLVAVFKTLVSAGVIVKSVFEQLGQVIYGVGAAVVRVAQGEFRLAKEEITSAFAQARASATDDIELIAQVWSNTVPQIQTATVRMDEALGESIIFNPAKAAARVKETSDAAMSALEQMYQDFDRATQTSLERQLDEWKKFDQQIDALLAAGRITPELANERMAENQAKYLEEIKITAEKIFPEPEREELNVFFEEASRGFQNLLADFLFDPFKDGIKGMLKGFGDMLLRMAAEAAAAQIMQKIFGSGVGTGTGSGGGWAARRCPRSAPTSAADGQWAAP
jgi:hypothetical protein